MKKTIASALGTASTLVFAVPAFAQNLNPCNNIGDPFNKLCNVNESSLPGVISNIVLILFIIAALVALFFLIWGGIKWILSGGDKAKVEAARSTIIAALIGLIITFLSFFLLQLILGFFGISITNLTLPNIFL